MRSKVSCIGNKGRRHRFVRPEKIVARGRANLTLIRHVRLGDIKPSDVCCFCKKSYGELFA